MSSLKDALLKLLEQFHNPELVGSILVIYVINGISQTVNIPHQFLHGLKVIIAPTEEAVLRLRPDAKGPRPEPLRRKEKEGKEPDAFDKMNALELVRLEVSRGTLGSLVYFPYYDTMVTWSLIAFGNFLVSEGSRCALPRRPMGWATLTLAAALLQAAWCNVRLIGLLGWDHDHGKFAVFCGFCGLFLSAACAAMLPRDFFVFDLWSAASDLHRWLGQCLAAAGLGESLAGLSEDDFAAMFLPIIAVAAAGITAAAALPSIRFAQYYHRALRTGSGAPLRVRILFVLDIALSWLAALSWIRSIFVFRRGLLGSGDHEGGWGGVVGSVDTGMHVWVTAAGGAVRLALSRTQLQMFLNGAKGAVLQELRERKVNPHAVRTKFEARLQYVVIAAAQYAAPALTVLLALALYVHHPGVDKQQPFQHGISAKNLLGVDRLSAGSSADTPMLWQNSGVSDTQWASEGLSLGVCDGLRWSLGAKPWRRVFEEALASEVSQPATSSAQAEAEADSGGVRVQREEPGACDPSIDALGLAECMVATESTEATEDQPHVNGEITGETQRESLGEQVLRSPGRGADSSGREQVRDTGTTKGAGLVSSVMEMAALPDSVWIGLMGFLAWWACLSWAITYAIGVVFWRLFPEEEAVNERLPRDRTTKATRDKESRGKGKSKARGVGTG